MGIIGIEVFGFFCMLWTLMPLRFVVWIAALRGAATLKARALKEVWNIAAVIPVEKGVGVGGNGNGSNGNSNSSFSGELVPEENFLGICSRELLAKGCEILKRTRKGKLLFVCFYVFHLKSLQLFTSLLELSWGNGYVGGRWKHCFHLR